MPNPLKLFKLFFNFVIDKKHRQIVLALLALLSTGTLIFHFVEGWRWFDSFYYCVITLATVGYGDFTPKTDLGKLCTIIYIVSGIGLFLAFAQSYFDFIKDKYRQGQDNK